MPHNNLKKALVVGGGRPHTEAIKKLKDLGFYTIVIDYTQSPPAKDVADKFISLNGFQEEILRKTAKEEKVSQIVNLCHDLAMPQVAKISAEMGLYFPFSYEQSLNYTNKAKMKRVMDDNSIPTAKFIHTDSILCNLDDFKFPIVVKPVDSSGSRGISKVNERSNVKEAIQIALDNSRNKDAIIEEYLTGKEYQVDCIVRDNTVQVVLLKQKLKFNSTEAISPAGSLILPQNKRFVSRFQKIAESLAKAFSINNCTFFYQCIDHNKKLNVIELGVRMGGGISYKMIKQVTGYDYLLATLYSQMGRKIETFTNFGNDYYMTCGIFANEGTISKIIIPDSYYDESIDSIDILKKEGDYVNGIITNKNRVALILFHGVSVENLCKKMRYMIDNIIILDNNNRNILKKDIYYKLIDLILEK